MKEKGVMKVSCNEMKQQQSVKDVDEKMSVSEKMYIKEICKEEKHGRK